MKTEKPQQKTFAREVKSKLALWGSDLNDLAAATGAHRSSVSRCIHRPARYPKLAKKIRKFLELAE